MHACAGVFRYWGFAIILRVIEVNVGENPAGTKELNICQFKNLSRHF
jgi:hypothetical protein